MTAAVTFIQTGNGHGLGLAGLLAHTGKGIIFSQNAKMRFSAAETGGKCRRNIGYAPLHFKAMGLQNTAQLRRTLYLCVGSLRIGPKKIGQATDLVLILINRT